MKIRLFLTALLCFSMFSCSEYNKLLKSSDYELRFEMAKMYFEEGKYSKTQNLLKDIVSMFKGTKRAEESLYLLARSAYLQGDYGSSGVYFETYYRNYPNGEYTELARYYTGMGYSEASPEPRLDQTNTYLAIEQLNSFLDYYPKSEKKDEITELIFTLQEKLAEKELLSAKLYLNLGDYRGNNYISAVVTAQNGIKDFPYSKYKEDFSIIILRAKYQEAQHSVVEKKAERFRNSIDEYYSYITEYPNGKYKKEAEGIYKVANQYINKH